MIINTILATTLTALSVGVSAIETVWKGMSMNPVDGELVVGYIDPKHNGCIFTLEPRTEEVVISSEYFDRDFNILKLKGGDDGINYTLKLPEGRSFINDYLDEDKNIMLLHKEEAIVVKQLIPRCNMNPSEQ